MIANACTLNEVIERIVLKVIPFLKVARDSFTVSETLKRHAFNAPAGVYQ
jgi:hypothetical protein